MLLTLVLLTNTFSFLKGESGLLQCRVLAIRWPAKFDGRIWRLFSHASLQYKGLAAVVEGLVARRGWILVEAFEFFR